MAVPIKKVAISTKNEGLQNLQSLVDKMTIQGLKPKISTPIVLVSGFSGWGEALLGTFNYWGGFEDLPGALQKAGYTVILVRIGPFSSNWERACEVYAQLTSGDFESPDEFPGQIIDIDYGKDFPSPKAYLHLRKTKKAALFGKLPLRWKWGPNNPLHFICHSQGGNTMRLLVELMSGLHQERHPAYFSDGNRQNWIKSIVTLGTPHKGTTIIDVVRGILPPPNEALDLITRFIVSVSFRTPRVYDLQLDHWGFCRLDLQNSAVASETFIEMYTRVKELVNQWWNGHNNGLYDNSLEGMKELNDFARQPSPDVFYFTMSFDVTEGFPPESLSAADLAAFPWSSPINHIPNPFNILGRIGAKSLALASHLPGSPTLAALAKWAVQVANNHLRNLGYFSQIPTPGNVIPRSDILPAFVITCLGMGGINIPPNLLPSGTTSAEFHPNDGIVNTISMSGPDDTYIQIGSNFPVDKLASKALSASARGIYWHLGINKTMDHGDEIGVFTVGATYREVEYMYGLFGELLSRLP